MLTQAQGHLVYPKEHIKMGGLYKLTTLFFTIPHKRWKRFSTKVGINSFSFLLPTKVYNVDWILKAMLSDR